LLVLTLSGAAAPSFLRAAVIALHPHFGVRLISGPRRIDYRIPGGSGCGLNPALMFVLTFIV
jgi:hypothetical protein